MFEIIIATCLTLCVLVAILTYQSHAQIAIKFVTLPLVVVFAFMTIQHFESIRGTPIEGYPEEHFTYVHHVNEGSQGEIIIIWIKDVKNMNKMFTFPYNRDIMKKLNQMKKKQEEGTQDSKGQFRNPNQGNNEEVVLHDYNGERTDAFNKVK